MRATRPAARSSSRRAARAAVALFSSVAGTTPATISSRAGFEPASGSARRSRASRPDSARGATSSARSGAGAAAGRRRTRPPPARAAPGTSRGQLERSVLAQDRLLQPPQLLARLESQLLRELVPSRAVGVERLGLPCRAVERQHELATQSLPEWLAADEPLELGDQLGVTPESKIGLDPLLQRRPGASPRAERSRPGRTARRPGPKARGPRQSESASRSLRAAPSGEILLASAASCSKRARSSSAGATRRT